MAREKLAAGLPAHLHPDNALVDDVVGDLGGEAVSVKEGSATSIIYNEL